MILGKRKTKGETDMKNRSLFILLCICAVSFIATIFMLPLLPEQIPIHWNVRGEIDNYASKYFSLVTAGLPIILYGLMKVLPNIDPKKENYKKHSRSYQVIIFVLLLFFLILHWVTIGITMGMNINLSIIINIIIGILFIILGNEMPRIRHNYFLGIKTPWTIADERTWIKTHRVGGYVFGLIGILFLLTSLFTTPIMFTITLGATLGGVLFLFIYSYSIYKHTNQ